jgi:hypothetical protein
MGTVMTQGIAFLLALAIEVPLVSAGVVALRLTGWRPAILLAAVVNLITHPVLWTALAPGPSLLRLVTAEVLVCLVESVLLWLPFRRDLLELVVLGTAANAASLATGLLFSDAFW